MERIFGAIAALAGAVAVIADAMAQHLAADSASAALAATGSRYALVHAAALLALAALLRGGAKGGWLTASGWCFVVALPLFCGVLFLHAAGIATWLVPLVPVGGTLFIIGWVALAIHFVAPRPPA